MSRTNHNKTQLVANDNSQEVSFLDGDASNCVIEGQLGERGQRMQRDVDGRSASGGGHPPVHQVLQVDVAPLGARVEWENGRVR